MISKLAYIDATAEVGNDVIVHPFAVIEAGVRVGDGCEIMSHVTLKEGVSMGKNNRIFEGVVIGASSQDPLFKGAKTEVRIGDNNVIRENVVISRGVTPDNCTIIGNNNNILSGARLSHDVHIGNNCAVGKGSIITGNCRLNDYALVSSGVLMNKFCQVGCHSLTLGGSVIYKNIPPYVRIGGYPAAYQGINTTIMHKQGLSDLVISNIAKAYRILYNSQISIHDAIQQIKDQTTMNEHIKNIIAFLENADLGIVGKESPCDTK